MHMLWCQNKNNAISAISLNFINKHINNFFQFVPTLTFVVIILSSVVLIYICCPSFSYRKLT